MDNAYQYLEGKGLFKTTEYGDGKYDGFESLCKAGKKQPEWYVDKSSVIDYSIW